jgi:preprotein translocase subunit YajC
MSFISPAYAQAAGGAGGAGGLEAMLPLILIFVVFYFLLIRPQQKKAKDHKAMLEAVRRGDKVVTGGGIIGTVTKVIDEQEITVEIADGIKVHVQRGLLAAVLAKTEPVKGVKKDKPVKGVKKDKKVKKVKKDDESDSDDGESKGSVSKLKGLLSGKS